MNFTEFLNMHGNLLMDKNFASIVTGRTPAPLPPWASDRVMEKYSSPGAWRHVCRPLVLGARCFFDWPFEKSGLRDDGWDMWDNIITMGGSEYRSNTDMRPVKMRLKAPIRSTNSTRTRMYNLFARGELGNCSTVLQVADRAAWNRRLDIAHAMAHAELDGQWHSSTPEKVLLTGSREFLQAFAELSIAEMYNIPIKPVKQKGDVSRLAYGIMVSATSDSSLLAPAPAMMPVSRDGDIFDKVLAVVHVAVEIGCDPIAMVMPGAKPSPWEDQWSGLPVRAMVLGWETADWFAGMDLALRPRTAMEKSKKEFAFYCHPDDLMHPQSFGFYLEGAELHMRPGREYSRPHKLVERPELVELLQRTPLLPCVQCMLRNRAVTATDERPDFAPPKGWEHDPAWKEYFSRMKGIAGRARKAAIVYDPTIPARGRARTAARAQYMKQLKKKEILKYGSVKERHG